MISVLYYSQADIILHEMLCPIDFNFFSFVLITQKYH